jgi:hypothetical protein
MQAQILQCLFDDLLRPGQTVLSAIRSPFSREGALCKTASVPLIQPFRITVYITENWVYDKNMGKP